MEDAIKKGHCAEWIEISKTRNPELIRDLMEKGIVVCICVCMFVIYVSVYFYI